MKKLLIVEDSKQFRRMLIDLLRGYYDKIYECADGKEATAAYKKFKPNCVLMDLQMKEMDGITATCELKKEHPEARVIIVTQLQDPELREQARKAGAEKYMMKDNLLELRNELSKRHNGLNNSNIREEQYK